MAFVIRFISFNSVTSETQALITKTRKEIIMSATQQEIMAVFPQGIILAWHTKSGVIPQGWALCNGDNDTPDLTGRFLRGVGKMNDVGQTGGSEQHEHRVVKNKDARNRDGFQ